MSCYRVRVMFIHYLIVLNHVRPVKISTKKKFKPVNFLLNSCCVSCLIQTLQYLMTATITPDTEFICKTRNPCHLFLHVHGTCSESWQQLFYTRQINIRILTSKLRNSAKYKTNLKKKIYHSSRMYNTFQSKLNFALLRTSYRFHFIYIGGTIKKYTIQLN